MTRSWEITATSRYMLKLGRERAAHWSWRGLPKIQMWWKRRRGSGLLASNEAIRQTIMNTCDADWHHAAASPSAALKTPECC